MPANSFFSVCCFSAPYKRTVQHESSSLNKYNIAVQKWNMVYLCEIVFLFILKEKKYNNIYILQSVWHFRMYFILIHFISYMNWILYTYFSNWKIKQQTFYLFSFLRCHLLFEHYLDIFIRIFLFVFLFFDFYFVILYGIVYECVLFLLLQQKLMHYRCIAYIFFLFNARNSYRDPALVNIFEELNSTSKFKDFFKSKVLTKNIVWFNPIYYTEYYVLCRNWLKVIVIFDTLNIITHNF